MTTQKNQKSLLSRAKNIMRKNDEFMSQINMNNSELPFSKVMNGGFNSEKMLNRLVKIGSDNYKNLKSKVPVLFWELFLPSLCFRVTGNHLTICKIFTFIMIISNRI